MHNYPKICRHLISRSCFPQNDSISPLPLVKETIIEVALQCRPLELWVYCFVWEPLSGLVVNKRNTMEDCST